MAPWLASYCFAVNLLWQGVNYMCVWLCMCVCFCLVWNCSLIFIHTSCKSSERMSDSSSATSSWHICDTSVTHGVESFLLCLYGPLANVSMTRWEWQLQFKNIQTLLFFSANVHLPVHLILYSIVITWPSCVGVTPGLSELYMNVYFL